MTPAPPSTAAAVEAPASAAGQGDAAYAPFAAGRDVDQQVIDALAAAHAPIGEPPAGG